VKKGRGEQTESKTREILESWERKEIAKKQHRKRGKPLEGCIQHKFTSDYSATIGSRLWQEGASIRKGKGKIAVQ